MQSGSTRIHWPLILIPAGLKVALHAATAPGYGIFVDELYYLDCARYLDWGYVDHPPLSVALLAGIVLLFGDSLWALRLPIAFLGGATIVLVGLIARGLGGGAFAQGLAALSCLAAPILLGLGNFYSMNAIDLFLWAAAGLLLVIILRDHRPGLWIPFGLLAGVGLMNKLSMGFLGAALAVALLLTPERRHFKHWQLYAGGALALLLFLPNIVWQFRNDFATLEFMRNAASDKNMPLTALEFSLAQFIEMHPFNALVWGAGLYFAFAREAGRPWRVFAWIWIALYLFFALTQSKPYYLAPAYLLLLPLGALAWERFTEGRHRARIGLAALLVVGGAASAPLALPLLPIERFIAYQAATGIKPMPAEVGHAGALLPQHFADRFGWPELAAFIGEAYQELPEELRAECDILVDSYGAAGALNYHGKAHGLPEPLATQNNHWIWGRGRESGPVYLVYRSGMTREDLLVYFDEVEELGRFTHPYVLPYRNDIPLYLCTGPNTSLRTLWPVLRRFQ